MDLRDKSEGFKNEYPSTLGGVEYPGSSRPPSLSPYLNIDPTYLNQGLAAGGSLGLYEGLRNPDGKSFKLRLNSVLNGCTRRGPFVANSLGILALMYCSLDSLIGKVRGEEDELNSIGAAVCTGMIFKSTAGLRPVAIAGALGGSLAAAYHFGEKLLEGRGQTISTPNWA